MRKKTFLFDGSEGAAEMLVLILNHFIDVAFPLGGSDCAAASRQALQAITGEINQQEFSELARRQRPILRSAVKWFYTESVYASPNDSMQEKLLSKLR
jgi:hypothetical protein